MAQYSEEKKQQCKKLILQQQKSGLPVARWCRENHIKEHIFYYWKNSLFPTTTIQRRDFSEIAEKPASSKKKEIVVECGKVRIYLCSDFDEVALKRCLEVLKEEKC